MIDIGDPTQWNFIFRRDLTATALKIPRQTFVTAAREVFVGIYVPERPSWYKAGFLTQYIPALPSSTNDLFTALTQVSNYPLTCRNYQIIRLVETTPAISICAIDFPRYFQQCQCEVFARNDIV